MAENPEKIGEAVAAYLGMIYRPVGVKILPTEVDGHKLEKRMTFCRFVREAAKGGEFLVRMSDLDCVNAEVALGFTEPRFVNIEPRIHSKTAAVRVGPLEGADVVLFILTAEQVMTMSILLEGITAKFRGDMAVCGEAVARVYTEGVPNVTFLCNGARLFGEYETHEVILALPYYTFLELPSRMSRFHSLSKKARDGFARLLLRLH